MYQPSIFQFPGIRLTRDSSNATIIAQNARVTRSWRSRFQESGALKLQSVPPYVDTPIFPITLHYRKCARRVVASGVGAVFPNNGNPVDYRK